MFLIYTQLEQVEQTRPVPLFRLSSELHLSKAFLDAFFTSAAILYIEFFI